MIGWLLSSGSLVLSCSIGMLIEPGICSWSNSIGDSELTTRIPLASIIAVIVARSISWYFAARLVVAVRSRQASIVTRQLKVFMDSLPWLDVVANDS